MPPANGRPRRWLTVLFIISGLVSLAGLGGRPPELMLPIYAVFVAACLARSALERAVGVVTRDRRFLALLGCFLVSGLLTETLAWAHNYVRAAPQPGLFHPQLGADLLIGLGFYGGWAVAWDFVLRRHRFALWEAFVLTGVQGIFFEQLGAIFLNILRLLVTQPIMALVFGLYVFLVHGSAAGLGLLPVLHRYDSPDTTRSWVRFPLAVALMVGLAFLGSLAVGTIALLFGGLPPKRSIVEHPFW